MEFREYVHQPLNPLLVCGPLRVAICRVTPNDEAESLVTSTKNSLEATAVAENERVIFVSWITRLASVERRVPARQETVRLCCEFAIPLSGFFEARIRAEFGQKFNIYADMRMERRALARQETFRLR